MIQILPEHLKFRAAYNPPLKSLAQLSPSFFDAPGARQVRWLHVRGPLFARGLLQFPRHLTGRPRIPSILNHCFVLPHSQLVLAARLQPCNLCCYIPVYSSGLARPSPAIPVPRRRR